MPITSNSTSDVILARIIEQIIQPIVYLLFAVAFLVFMWGLFKMIRNADDEKELKTGKSVILYGTLGLLIMFGAQGIIQLIKGTFGL